MGTSPRWWLDLEGQSVATDALQLFQKWLVCVKWHFGFRRTSQAILFRLRLKPWGAIPSSPAATGLRLRFGMRYRNQPSDNLFHTQARQRGGVSAFGLIRRSDHQVCEWLTNQSRDRSSARSLPLAWQSSRPISDHDRHHCADGQCQPQGGWLWNGSRCCDIEFSRVRSRNGCALPIQRYLMSLQLGNSQSEMVRHCGQKQTREARV